jgi:uncharacterized membrane protein YdjX (TVP38/TMEM64 family)
MGRVLQSGRWVLMLVYLLLIVGLTLAWQQPSMRQHMEPAALARYGRALLDMPLGPVLVLGGYVLAVLLAMPVGVLITVGVLVFGPWPGMAYALAGMVCGSMASYGVGLLAGADVVDRWSQQGRIHALAMVLKRRGLWAIVLVRAVPVAPFVLINMTAGAFRVRFRDFVLGTALGLAPGTVIISLFMDRLTAALADPGAVTYGVLAVLALGIVGLLFWLRQVVRRETAKLASEEQNKVPSEERLGT